MNKQEAVEYWQSVYENNENYCDENWDADEKQAHQRWCEALRTVLDLLEEQRGWIPVSERLPDKNGHYLVYAPSYRGGSSSAKENHDGIMFSRFSNGKWSIEHGYYERINCVIAWMPLPSSYQGE